MWSLVVTSKLLNPVYVVQDISLKMVNVYDVSVLFTPSSFMIVVCVNVMKVLCWFRRPADARRRFQKVVQLAS
jgi:hypothetical protein